MSEEYVEPPKFRIPADRLNLAVRTAYDLSVPQGLGFLHAQPGAMTEEEAEQVINITPGRAIRLDYVKGRAVKLSLNKDEEGYYVHDHGDWYDHGPRLWDEFKRIVGATP